jgi:hypothetical protein
MQIPSAEEGGNFKKAWFDIIEPSTLTREPINSPIHLIVDSAYTAKTENDPTAILACLVKDRFLYVVDAKEVWL